MELREIETFLAIVEQGTFSKAAEKLGYSQSAVTVQIKQLEHELGARLFDRVPRGAALTEQGRAFAFHANEIAGAARAARASVASAQAAPKTSRAFCGWAAWSPWRRRFFQKSSSASTQPARASR